LVWLGWVIDFIKKEKDFNFFIKCVLYMDKEYINKEYINKEYINKIIFSSGEILLPDSVRNPLMANIVGSSQKTFYISGWSIIHIINGILFGYLYLVFKYDMKRYVINMLILHTCWEGWQMLIGMSKPYKLTGPNNLIDTFMDTLLFMVGAYVALKIYK
jgi:hypothetical protein